jgi:hypothetical protein
VDASARTRAALGAKGVKFVDAPLTRTPAAAEEGKANTMVGADAATFQALHPVFAAYCEHIIHAGPPGHGLVLKLINNFVGQAITTATAEGLATAAKVGLDIAKLHQLMSLGSVNNLMFQFMVKNMLDGGPEQLDGLKFSLSNAEKDVRAVARAAGAHARRPFGAARARPSRPHPALAAARPTALALTLPPRPPFSPTAAPRLHAPDRDAEPAVARGRRSAPVAGAGQCLWPGRQVHCVAGDVAGAPDGRQDLHAAAPAAQVICVA